MTESKRRKIPDQVNNRMTRLSKVFDVPVTKAFILQEKFLLGDCQVRKKKKVKGKMIYEMEFEI